MSIAPLSRREKTKKRPLSGGMLFILLVLAFSLAVLIFFLPGFFQAPVPATQDVRLYYLGLPAEEKGFYEEEMLYLPFTFVEEYLDSSVRLDETGNTVIITTEENVFHFPFGIKEGLLNLEPYEFTYPVLEKEGKVYLAVEPLQDIYQLEIITNQPKNRASIYSVREPVQMGRVLQDTRLRTAPGRRSAWVAKVALQEEVRIVREERGWYWVEQETGEAGYIAKEDVALAGIRLKDTAPPKVYQPWNPLGRPIVLTWEYVGRTTASPAQIGELPGVEVLSPTWFELQPNGRVLNKADKRTVDWAHSKGRQVWGLFSNSFDKDLTKEFLASSELRIKVIKQLLSYVDLYELDGINLDFENMYLQDKEAFVAFVRELAPLLHEKGRVLTIDVTFHSLSETWSLCYDRKQLAEAADYLIVMGYDEYGGGSPVAGSVSSLPWVEKGLQKMLLEVPPDKLILGIPFYTRVWTETMTAEGTKKVTSKAYSLKAAEDWLKANGATVTFDEKNQQNYAEVQKEGVTSKMWLEDDYSLEKRIELMKEYRLAGLAAWRRGYEKADTWAEIAKLVGKVW